MIRLVKRLYDKLFYAQSICIILDYDMMKIKYSAIDKNFI